MDEPRLVDEGCENAPAREQLECLFALSPDLFCIAGFDGYLKLLNPAWEQLLGWSRDELLASPIEEFVHPEDLERTRALMRAGGSRPSQLENFTNRYRHRDGSWRWLLWSARCASRCSR